MSDENESSDLPAPWSPQGLMWLPVLTVDCCMVFFARKEFL